MRNHILLGDLGHPLSPLFPSLRELEVKPSTEARLDELTEIRQTGTKCSVTICKIDNNNISYLIELLLCIKPYIYINI